MEYKPILEPGIHNLTIEQVEDHFLKNFSIRSTRPALVRGLKQLIRVLKGMEIKFEIWLDGSFTTDKPNPEDIDVVLFAEKEEVDELHFIFQELLLSIVNHRQDTKDKYGCDVYFSLKNDNEVRECWCNWFGFDRHGAPKGIAKIELS